jgi:hypothetical protein
MGAAIARPHDLQDPLLEVHRGRAVVPLLVVLVGQGVQAGQNLGVVPVGP